MEDCNDCLKSSCGSHTRVRPREEEEMGRASQRRRLNPVEQKEDGENGFVRDLWSELGVLVLQNASICERLQVIEERLKKTTEVAVAMKATLDEINHKLGKGNNVSGSGVSGLKDEVLAGIPCVGGIAWTPVGSARRVQLVRPPGFSGAMNRCDVLQQQMADALALPAAAVFEICSWCSLIVLVLCRLFVVGL
ncbi:hypothetical protein SUGI_1076910 [Cryptomeria japonica]|nr:hypothetical protein SUGI_1076910 [Cryptomeria japonica]